MQFDQEAHEAGWQQQTQREYQEEEGWLKVRQPMLPTLLKPTKAFKKIKKMNKRKKNKQL